MFRTAALWILCFLFLGNFALQAQTVDEVIAGYENALGGKDKLKTLQSVYLEGVSVAGNGNEIISKVTKVDQKLLRQEISFGMGTMKVLVTDQGAWAANPRNNGAFEAMPQERFQTVKGELDITGPLVNYAAKGHKAELLGKEAVNGKDAYKIKLTLNTGNDITYFIDAGSYLLVREVRKGGAGMMGGGGPRRQGANGNAQPQEITVDYSDYQKTPEGFVFPFKVTRAGMGGETIYEKIEVNKPVDAKLYKAE